MEPETPTLPAEQDEREEKLGRGVAMIASGASYRQAREATGIPLSTLHSVYKRISSQGSEREKEELDARIIGHAYTIADLAAAELTSRMEDPEQRTKMPSKELMTAYGIATDKVSLKRGWTKPQDTANDGWLNKLASGMKRIKSVSVELADPADEAIDVTPTR